MSGGASNDVSDYMYLGFLLCAFIFQAELLTQILVWSHILVYLLYPSTEFHSRAVNHSRVLEMVTSVVSVTDIIVIACC